MANPVGSHVSAFQTSTVRMSSRQCALLRALEGASAGVVRVQELMGWNQQTLGSCKRRAFIRETNDKHGVTLTPLGKKALAAYRQADFYRQVSSLHFSTFISLEPPANLLKSLEREHPRMKVSAVRRAHALAA